MKTVPVRELSQNGASKVIAAAEAQPVLVTKNNEPSVWMVSARDIALASAQRAGDDSVYRDALAVVAVDLYRRGLLSIGRAARLAGTSLADFILLSGKMQVPVLREPPSGLEAELAGLEAALRGQRPPTKRDSALPDTVPVPHGDPKSVRVSALVAHTMSRTSATAENNAEEYLTAAANLVA